MSRKVPWSSSTTTNLTSLPTTGSDRWRSIHRASYDAAPSSNQSISSLSVPVRGRAWATGLCSTWVSSLWLPFYRTLTSRQYRKSSLVQASICRKPVSPSIPTPSMSNSHRADSPLNRVLFVFLFFIIPPFSLSFIFLQQRKTHTHTHKSYHLDLIIIHSQNKQNYYITISPLSSSFLIHLIIIILIIIFC